MAIEKKLLFNIAGSYVDLDSIAFAKQKGANEVVIHIKGTSETVTVGVDYWAGLCAKYFQIAQV